MSERGTFVTEWMYCEACREQALRVLSGIPDLDVIHGHSVIAGRVSSSFVGGEVHVIEFDAAKELSSVLCHPLRISVLCDDATSDRVVVIRPDQPGWESTKWQRE